MIEHLHQAHGYAVAMLCKVVGLPRSTYYHRPTSPDDTVLAKAILDILGTFPTYGTRRVTAQLRRAPYRMQVSRKRVQRVMRQKGWLQAVKKRKVRTTQSQHGYRRYPNLVKGLQVQRPDQVWVSDITYIRLAQGFVYLAVIMDVFTRRIRGWALSRHLDQQLTLTALEQAVATHVPEIHHSDQGVQYAATAYVAALEEHGVHISMAGTGMPEENGYAERLMRTIKEEEVALSDYRDLSDARQQIGRFLEEVYQHKRIHSSLGYLTPAEFEAAWLVKQAEEKIASAP